MSFVSLIHFGVVVTTFTLGALVFRTNPKRATNQVYSLLSISSGLWVAFISFAFVCTTTAFATTWIRTAHSVGATIPLLCDWLLLAIMHPDLKLRQIINLNPTLLFTTMLFVFLAQTPWIIESAHIPEHGSHPAAIPDAILGPYYFVFATFFALVLGTLAFRFLKSRIRSSGMQRVELNFICLGVLTSIAMGITVSILTPLITGSSQSTQLASLSVMTLNFIIAYGIATRRIMEMAYLFRLLTSYVLAALYLMLVYLLFWWPTHHLATFFDIHAGIFPHALAAIMVAFSMAPAHGLMQRFANRLFVHTAPLSMMTVTKLTNQILRSISTVDTLLNEFATAMAEAFGTDKVCILLAGQEGFTQNYPPIDHPDSFSLSKSDPLPTALSSSGELIVPAILRRLSPSPVSETALTTIETHGYAAAIGLQSKEGLEGILLLGPKLNGHIYGSPEQHALQLLCNHMAVALNNARLYTQLQDSMIYNEILVDSLISGVIAVRHDGLITVFNREAQRITGLTAPAALNHPLTTLPPPLDRLLKDSLESGTEILNHEFSLSHNGSEPTPVRVNSLVIFGHTGKRLGAFLVINDLTTIKQLELQVRRTDRLASLGTLAAGMAHEIKNPLVSIKTFTQLLPERYSDADFRETFASLVGGEVKRIDSIVNQLLRFSRPAKPVLSPLTLHDLLNSTLKLLQQQMRAKNIRLVSTFTAVQDQINADGDQLSQAFINFFLNAIESMEKSGTLTVTTSIPTPGHPAHAWWKNGKPDHPVILVTIQDTGEGISPEALPHIFDPFFTTKGQGTGLGLSVAHGIIHEHGGLIDVSSEVGRGTLFTVVFPLLHEEGRS